MCGAGVSEATVSAYPLNMGDRTISPALQLEDGVNNKSIVAVLFLVFAMLRAVELRAQSVEDTAVSAPDPAPAAATTPDKRLFGVLPNYRTVDAAIPFAKISNRQKLNIARHDSFDWPTYVLAGVLTFATPKDKNSH